jgi:hypothetical protein
MTARPIPSDDGLTPSTDAHLIITRYDVCQCLLMIAGILIVAAAWWFGAQVGAP